jgi:predicted TIM-barrel fold metal-dependent hydrolase
LPADEARPLLAAWHDAVLGLEPVFGAWGSVALRDAGAADVDALLDRGAVGLTLPAGALAGPDRLERVAPLLEALERRDAPLFVHPGGAEHGPRAPIPPSPWWPALTDYVASLQSAWLAFSTWGRRAHPRLRVVFAALAGLAPLHAERVATRGGPRGAATDPLVFYDTSSYGHRAIDAIVRMVGIDAIVHGSDRPVVDAVPPHRLGTAADHALKVANVTRLLHGGDVPLREAA